MIQLVNSVLSTVSWTARDIRVQLVHGVGGLFPPQLGTLGQGFVRYGTYLVVPPMQTRFAGYGHSSSCVCKRVCTVCAALVLSTTYVQFSAYMDMTLASCTLCLAFGVCTCN